MHNFINIYFIFYVLDSFTSFLSELPFIQYDLLFFAISMFAFVSQMLMVMLIPFDTRIPIKLLAPTLIFSFFTTLIYLAFCFVAPTIIFDKWLTIIFAILGLIISFIRPKSEDKYQFFLKKPFEGNSFSKKHFLKLIIPALFYVIICCTTFVFVFVEGFKQKAGGVQTNVYKNEDKNVNKNSFSW